MDYYYRRLRLWRRKASVSLINRTLGTNIGSLTASGGLAAAFDGTNHNTSSTSAARSGTDGYVGKTLAAASKIDHAVAYSSTVGFVSAADPEITLELYGKTGAAPANATDGTLLATSSFTDTAGNIVTELTSTDKATVFDHVWLRVSSAGSVTWRVGELELWAAP